VVVGIASNQQQPKSIQTFHHEAHEGHEGFGKYFEFLNFVLFVAFVVQCLFHFSSALLQIGLTNFQVSFDQMNAQVCRTGF